MKNKFVFLPGLILPEPIKNLLLQVDWQSQSERYSVQPSSFFRNIIKTSAANQTWPGAFFKHYGIFLQRLGDFRTVQVSDNIIQMVEQHWTWIQHMPEKPVVRLQIVFNGDRIPLHIDLTRSVSLIYPISNHSTALTNFYTSKKPLPRGMLNPADCVLEKSICIDQSPALLNVDAPHDVRYPQGSLTKTNPRISFNLKWQNMSFQQVASHLENYTC